MGGWLTQKLKRFPQRLNDNKCKTWLIDGEPKRIDHERNDSRRVHGDADFAAAEISIANETGFALHGMRGAGGERIAVPEASGDGARVATRAPCAKTPIFWDTQLQARIDELKQRCNRTRTGPRLFCWARSSQSPPPWEDRESSARSIRYRTTRSSRIRQGTTWLRLVTFPGRFLRSRLLSVTHARQIPPR